MIEQQCKWKKIALGLFAVTQLLVFTACGSQDTTTTGEEFTIYGEVTKISGSDITLALGALNDMTQPQAPASSENNAEGSIKNTSYMAVSTEDTTLEDTTNSNGNPPDGGTKPSGDPPDGGTKPSGVPPDSTAPSAAKDSSKTTDSTTSAETKDSIKTTDGNATDDKTSGNSDFGTDTPGTSPDGTHPPDMSQGGFSMLTLTGEEKTITVTDENIITASKDKTDSTETGLDSIQVGDTLMVKYKQNKDGSETLLSIEKMGGGGPKEDTANATVESTGSYSQRGDSVRKSDETIMVTEDNPSAVRVTDNAPLTLTNCGIITSGNSTNSWLKGKTVTLTGSGKLTATQ